MSVKGMIQIIVQAMLDKPGEVSIPEIKGGQTTVLELKVARNALGKVIGKHGRVETISAIIKSPWDRKKEDDFDEAARLMRLALAIRRKVLGKNHPVTISSLGSLVIFKRLLKQKLDVSSYIAMTKRARPGFVGKNTVYKINACVIECQLNHIY